MLKPKIKISVKEYLLKKTNNGAEQRHNKHKIYKPGNNKACNDNYTTTNNNKYICSGVKTGR